MEVGQPDRHEGETEHQRLDRNLQELLEELRVALPGVQVLFAFLLVVPFNQRFADVTPFQVKVYFVTLLCSAVTSVFLIAPSVYHRLLFRKGQRKYLVATANRFAVAGLTTLALAITGVILLVTDVLFKETTTAIATASMALMFLFFWFAIPLRRRLQS